MPLNDASTDAMDIRANCAYDLRHRLSGLVKRTAASALLLAMSYSVDASGLRTGVEESDALGITRTVAYQYDAQKRLISETIDHRDDANDHIGQWTYDRVGNRLSQTVTQGGTPNTTAYTYDANDRLLTESGAVSASYSYDAQGNTTSKTGPDGTTSYQYNDANRLIEAITPHAALAYAYTADGLRASQTVTAAGGSPITTQYVQDTAYPYAQVIEEYTAEGANPRQLAATFTFADELISQTRYDATGIPATTFVQADGFGSTRWLTDGTGQITDSIDFDAFGNEIARSGTTDLEHLYRGERWDASLAAYDLRARLYTPANGRFLTQDSFAGFASDPRSLHKYAYTHNDPVNGIDPSGHMTMSGLSAGMNIMANMAIRAMSIAFTVDRVTSTGATILETLILVTSGRGAALIDQTMSLSSAIAGAHGVVHGHHTIPQYMGGHRQQKLAGLKQSMHAALHSALQAQEFFANRMLNILWRRLGHMSRVGNRRSPTLDSLCQNMGGRVVVSGFLYFFYDWTGVMDVGELKPTDPRIAGSVRDAFSIEAPRFIRGHRSCN